MKIALFGAGKDGIQALYNIGKNRISYFIDTRKNGKIENIPIISLDQIPDEEKENLLILITSRTYKNEMEEQLKKEGYSNYLVYENTSFEQKYQKRLSVKQWGELYNQSLIDDVIHRLNKNSFSIQTQEMIKITQKGDKILEIGCGSGETSLILAKEGRNVTAIDYSQRSIDLVNKLVQKTGYNVNTYCIDATNELPFKKNYFDIVFQAGLLEHFEKKDRIKMLSTWKRVCKRMVSLIPNAHCLAYRAGKQLAEEKGTWIWGLEMPQSTLMDDFKNAGYENIKEYTIGEEHALNFLPEDHYLRVAISRWFNDKKNISNWGQGYLLVTDAKNPEQ